MLRDRIVFSTNSQIVKEQLINEGDTLTLEKAIQIAQTHEYSQKQLKRMNNTPTMTAEVHAVKPRNSTRSYTSKASLTSHGSHGSYTHAASKQRTRNQSVNKEKSCGKCGLDHSLKGTCPAKGSVTSVRNGPLRERLQVKGCKWIEKVLYHIEGESENDLYIDSIQSQLHDDQAFSEFSVGLNNKIVKFKLDTGSQVVMPNHMYCKLNNCGPSLKPECTLSACNGNVLPSLGICHIPYSHKSCQLETTTTSACKASTGTPKPRSVMSKSPMTNQSVLNENSDLFKGISLLPGEASIYRWTLLSLQWFALPKRPGFTFGQV